MILSLPRLLSLTATFLLLCTTAGVEAASGDPLAVVGTLLRTRALDPTEQAVETGRLIRAYAARQAWEEALSTVETLDGPHRAWGSVLVAEQALLAGKTEVVAQCREIGLRWRPRVAGTVGEEVAVHWCTLLALAGEIDAAQGKMAEVPTPEARIQARTKIALGMAAAGRGAEARELVRGAVDERNPTHLLRARAFCLLGELALSQKESAQALSDFTEAADLLATTPITVTADERLQAISGLLRCEAQAKADELRAQGEARAKGLLRLADWRPIDLAMWARARAELGQKEEAVALLTEAEAPLAELQPLGRAAGLAAIGAAYHRLGDATVAAQRWGTAAREAAENPNPPTGLLGLLAVLHAYAKVECQVDTALTVAVERLRAKLGGGPE